MDTSERTKYLSAALVFFIKDGEILLARRFQTGFADGQYSLPSGHIDKGETPTQAAIREAKEEIGVSIKPADLKFAHAMFRKGTGGTWADYFFACERWQGEPKIMEPNKCDDVQWFPLDKLPDNLVSFVRQALKNYQNNIPFSEYGW